jgi:predicted nucleic acid-binding protein
MVVFDTNVLIALCSPKTSKDDLARLNALIAGLSKKRTYVGIPTPVLAEFLVRTDSATEAVLRGLERKSSVRVLAFDKRAAYECALMDRNSRGSGGKRGKGNDDPYQKVKIDRQTVAIAMTNQAEMVVSGDGGLINVANAAGLKAVRISDLPIPASAMQREMFEEDGTTETAERTELRPSIPDVPTLGPQVDDPPTTK